MTSRARNSGLTMIEIVLVIVVLGILFGMAYPALEGASPKYSLRAAARKVGSQVGWARSVAVTSGETHHFHYDLTNGTCWMILPPPEDEDPDMPLEDREVVGEIELPHLVRFEKLMTADGEVFENEEVDIEFDPLGFSGSHIVYLRNTEDHLITIKYNALLGIVDFYNEEIEFQEF